MKNVIHRILAVIMAAIFVFGVVIVSAAPSPEKVNKDYRNMDILNKQGVKVNKPTAQFSANRVVNGEVVDMAVSYVDYDLSAEYPTLVCYVGDTLTFTDMSKSNNGGKIIEWDWQYNGALGNYDHIYNRNIVNEAVYELTEPGETLFYLCVRNDNDVRVGCCDSWSENGNHQVVGINKWFPKGAYWYFTAIRVVVKPIREAVVHVRYWDAQNNKVFHEGTVNAGEILEDSQTVDTTFHITDWDGYEYSGWNVQLMDGTIQYSGVERNVNITLAAWITEKYLNIEYYPLNDKSLEVRYIDLKTNEIIKTNMIQPENDNIRVEFENIPGYVIEDWTLKTSDGDVEKVGIEEPVDVILTDENPDKILEVNCLPLGGYGGGNAHVTPDVIVKPNGVCDGVITWTETDSHNVLVGYKGNSKPVYSQCNHTFKYKAVLGAAAQISPTILKSGYGFSVDVDCTINTSMVSNTGCNSWGNDRTPSSIVNNPTTATVFVPWDMTNRLGSQGRSISMVSNEPLKFTLPASRVSETEAKKIYTPVELAGTKENPESHSFEIYIGGGGVGSVEFCQKLNGTITINGDMYEDDFSGAN